MKLVVLCDNNTYIDNYLLGEPALSFYLKNFDDEILFDVGYSNVFLKNAESLNIDIKNIKKIVLSHGHDDHTKGLLDISDKKQLFYCKGCFDAKRGETGIDASAPYSLNEIQTKFDAIEVNSKLCISQNLYILGPIPRQTNFEKVPNTLLKQTKDGWVVDDMQEDTALVYDGQEGLTIITGCSHSGICNIILYAKSLFNKPVKMVIGGFHLLKFDDQAQKTIDFLKQENIEKLYPCHCTCFDVKAEMKNQGLNVIEVGSGLTLEI